MKNTKDTFFATVNIPIYNGLLSLYVSEDPTKTRISKENVFGEYNSGQAIAIAATDASYNYYGLFFSYHKLTHGIISHEIFHLTHRILFGSDVYFGMESQEAHAYFNTWLTDWVYAKLKEAKVRVR